MGRNFSDRSRILRKGGCLFLKIIAKKSKSKCRGLHATPIAPSSLKYASELSYRIMTSWFVYVGDRIAKSNRKLDKICS